MRDNALLRRLISGIIGKNAMLVNYLRLRLLLTFMLLIVLGAAAVTYMSGLAVINSKQEIVQRQEVTQALTDTLSLLTDAETGQRGYLLTADQAYLAPYVRAVGTIVKKIARLNELAGAGLLEKKQTDEIQKLVDEKLSELSRAIAIRDAMGLDAALALLQSGEGRITMVRLRDLMREVMNNEQVTLDSLNNRSYQLTLLRTNIFVGCAALEALFCLWAYKRIVAEMRRHSEAAAEIRRQKNLLSVTLGSIGDAVMVCDLDARVTFINAMAETLTGWNLSEARGMPLNDIFRIINEESRNTVESPVDKVLRTGKVVGLANHTLLIRKDGSELPIDDSGAPIRDAEGKIYGVVLVFRDFSDHKNAEKGLLQAKAEAEAANRAKDQFLATLSHELRTPLTPVSATLNMWDASEEVPAALKPDIQMMRRNVDLESRLIDDLLDLTRITRGKLSLNLEPINMHDLLTSVVGIVRQDAAARKVRLKLNLHGRRIFLSGDGARVQQIMWNLLKNAIKFTPEGGEVEVETCDDADGCVTFRVKDSGIGIAADMIPRLFRPFEQGEQNNHRFGGLGLGLAIARALVEAQGGMISAESPGVGKGATFTVRFPAIPAPAPGAQPEPVQQASTKQVRILLVEDHPDSAQALARIITRFGHKVQIATSVAEGLAAFQREPFDLLVSDLGLPDGSGLDLLRQIRALRPIPAIALTGFGMEDDIARSRDAGFSAHLTKPVNFQKLDAALSKIIEEEIRT